ncbi:MAG: carbon-nitrogen hydrolase family protein, partial [Methylococcales bacterium]|nr:carbon-nitrogen hydrolase family protein [Methylococcales bacterium]
VPLSIDNPDKYRSSALVFNDRGEMVHRYDKTHLFDVKVVGSDEEYIESATIEAGNQMGVVDTPFGKLGVAICYDLRFPEIFRMLLEQGMEILALPSAFTAITGKAHWEILVRARAIENLSYVIAADQGGFHINGRETYGHSLIVDPWGNALNELSSGAGAVTVDINRESLERVREQFPAISHRRIHCRCDD